MARTNSREPQPTPSNLTVLVKGDQHEIARTPAEIVNLKARGFRVAEGSDLVISSDAPPLDPPVVS